MRTLLLGVRSPFARRRIFALLFALLGIVSFVQPASAAIRWCRTDPIVRLNGVTYQVFISIPQENVQQVDGELFFEIYSPKGTKQELLFVDEGYNGYGEKVVLKQHDVRNKHTFYLDVPHNNNKFPVKMEILRNGKLFKTVIGTSDVMWVSVPTP
jgi:hypothetical protein